MYSINAPMHLLLGFPQRIGAQKRNFKFYLYPSEVLHTVGRPMPAWPMFESPNPAWSTVWIFGFMYREPPMCLISERERERERENVCVTSPLYAKETKIR